MPIAWAELPAPVQQLVYEGLGVMGVLALNREWRACRERRVAERLPCDTHNVPSSLPGGIVLRLLPNYAIEPEVDTEWVETRKVPSKRHTQGACSHIYVKGTRDIVLSRDYNLTPQLIVLFKRGNVPLPEYVCSSGAMHGPSELMHILATTAQYFFMLPFFINVLSIYAFSNLHDLSWGTKGLETDIGHGGHGGGGKRRKRGAGAGGGAAGGLRRRGGQRHGDAMAQVSLAEKAALEQRNKKQRTQAEISSSFNVFRAKVLVLWLVANGFVVVFVERYVPAKIYVGALAGAVSAVNLYRFGGCTMFIVIRALRGSLYRLCPQAYVLERRRNEQRANYASLNDDLRLSQASSGPSLSAL